MCVIYIYIYIYVGIYYTYNSHMNICTFKILTFRVSLFSSNIKFPAFQAPNHSNSKPTK